MKNMLKRLEDLEVVALEQWRKRQEQNKRLHVKISNNEAILSHGGKVYRLTAETPFNAVKGVEDFILQAKPEMVSMFVSFSGVCALIPELAEYDEGKEVDTYFGIYGGISGDYYELLSSNEKMTLVGIIICEALYPYFGGSMNSIAMGITFKSEDLLSIADSIAAIVYLLLDYAAKAKAFGEEPKNRWSEYFSERTCVNG